MLQDFRHNLYRLFYAVEERPTVSVLPRRAFDEFIHYLQDRYPHVFAERTKLVQDLFILHQFAQYVYKLYRKSNIRIKPIVFRYNILIPCMVYLCMRYTTSARKFLRDIINKVFYEYRRYHYDLLNWFMTTTGIDLAIIKSDMLLKLLLHTVSKQDPLKIHNLNAFYATALRRLVNFHFKRKMTHMFYTDYVSSHIGESSLSRLGFYKNILQSVELEHTLRQSPTLQHISYRFDIYKNLVVPHELHKLYASYNHQPYNPKLTYLSLLTNREFLSALRHKVPKVARVMRSIHVVYLDRSKRPTGYGIKRTIATMITDTLSTVFRDMLGVETEGLLERVAATFANTFVSGNYVDPATFDIIKLEPGIVSELKDFFTTFVFGVDNG